MAEHQPFPPAEDLPALPRGTFAGSCRIQRLSAPPRIWMGVTALAGPARAARIRLTSVWRVPPLSGELSLFELTAPFPSVERRLVSPEAAVRFRAAAADALRELEVPIAVQLNSAGRATRPRDLFALRGFAPGSSQPSTRVELDRPPRQILDHLEKHFGSPEELSRWTTGFATNSPVTCSALKAAARYPGWKEAPPDLASLDGLLPAHWPLLECYVAITVDCFERILESDALHLAREPSSPGRSLSLLEEIISLALREDQLPPGEESLFVAVAAARAIARGQGGLRRALPWRSSYGTGDRDSAATLDRLEALAGRLGSLVGVRRRAPAGRQNRSP